ncbi:GTPase-activating Rap/Ran-GAP domain-like protein 3 [Sycon ciliatum]|uniref:GTPase-activating Rap/Ran-GAP domain-like protein 3 n=1 Tax=Sycon ciliatum TaxID=27933 RepID=UPI0020AB7354|eukprot:scpid30288/ scgid27524/ GTPase-activating Rap/Ran-GAP domain-like protein 3
METPEKDQTDRTNQKVSQCFSRGFLPPEVAGRKHYGFVKSTSASNDGTASPCHKYRVEAGDCGTTTVDGLENSWILAQMENPETETRWYFKHFLGKVHNYYIGVDINKDAFVVATCLEKTASEEFLLRSVLFRKTGCLRLALRCKGERPFPVKMLLQSFSVQAVKHPKPITCPTFQKELVVLENQEGSKNFKFGVLYCQAHQVEDDDFFSNETGSKEFDQFVELLGDKVELLGFKDFRGGLDVRTGTTGTHSIHTKFQGHEVMFHVSTMLPFSKQNKQQLERKRHLGNDIVVIVFFDGDELPEFQPAQIKSHFNHIFAAVCYSKKEEAYKLQLYSDRNVPLFSPALPNPAIFTKDKFQLFRSFLLVKLINGEKACYQSQTFREKRQRTLSTLLAGYEEQYGESHSKLSDMVSSKSTKKKKEQESEFIRIGQELKAHEMMKGDVPIAEVPDVNDAAQSWDVSHFMTFSRPIDFAEQHCNSLVVHGDEGTFILDGKTSRPIIEKSITVKHVIVCEEHNVFLVLGSKYVHCFRLSALNDPDMPPIGRNEMKLQRVEATKGASSIAVCRGVNIMLRLAVAIGRRLQMFVWKTPATNQPGAPEVAFEGPEGFLELESINIQETPSTMLLVDHHQVQSYQHNKVIVSYRNVHDVVDEHTHDVERLFENPTNAMVTSPIVDHYEEDKVELLVTYNNMTEFKDISALYGVGRKQTMFHWTCMPHNIVCKFPYVIAFGRDSIEIRLYINGTVVKNMMGLRDVKLLSSKRNILFTSSHVQNGDAPEASPCKGQALASQIYTLVL